MSFGQRIKTLRREANMTQEQRAELLSISPQAVSRWETDMAMPDISLLPPLANLFHVTTDHLLGMDTYQRDLRKAEFDEAFHEYWLKDEEFSYQTALRAVAEYPGNMEYMEWLAWAEYYLAIPCKDDEKYNRLLESALKHHKIVFENLKTGGDRERCNKVLRGMVFAISALGRKEEAKEYALQIGNEDERDEMLSWCLEGEERIRHGQKTADKLLSKYIFQLRFTGDTIEACTATEKILQILIPDGNYQYYHNILQYNAFDKARVLCARQRYDEVVAELKKARYHAEEMVKYHQQDRFRFTAPLYDRMEGEVKTKDANAVDVDNFIGCLGKPCFDPIRDREDFKALLKK